MRHAEDPISMVVTASGSGIGPAVADRLARAGHHIALVGRDAAVLDRLAGELDDLGEGSVRVLPGDPTRPKRIRRFVDEMLIHYGRIDNFVYVPTRAAHEPFLKSSTSTLEERLELTLRGPWNWMQAVIPVMLDHEGGRLIFMGASTGRRGRAERSAESAAAAALHALLESVGREHRPQGVQTVSLVLDGPVDDSTRRRRHPDKTEWDDTIDLDSVAEAVHYLCNQNLRAMTHELWLTPSKTDR